MKNFNDLCPYCFEELKGETTCKSCGKDVSALDGKNVLKPGTKIMQRYLVGAATEQGGDGVTYVCYDAKTDSKLMLREFFPTDIASRGEKGSVTVNEGKEAIFAELKAKFTSLAETLRSHADVPSIPHIGDVFEGNGTAYWFYDYRDEITLREFLLRNGGKLEWKQASMMFLPLLSALSAIHSFGIVHRGISPETIRVGKDGKVRLLGFCIEDARMNNSSLQPQIFPGFAAVEQYGSIGTVGTHTDVYSAAATLYRVLVGNPPVESIERVTNDTLSIPQKVLEKMPKKVAEALADALAIMPEERISSASEFRSVLASARSNEADAGKKAKNKIFRSYSILAAILTVLVLSIIAAVLYITVFRKEPVDEAPVSSVQSVVSTESEIPSTFSGTTKVKGFVGLKYGDVVADSANSAYVYVIDAKEYNSDYTAGKIIKQTPAPGELVDPDENGKIEIHITVSLGSRSISVPDLSGMSLDVAYSLLFKEGFSFPSVSVVEQYDSTKAPHAVIGTDKEPGTTVTPDDPITIYYNTYLGEDE